MSYVRFSSDNHRSDVYVFADVKGGYTLMIAQNRFVGPEPRPELPPLTQDGIDAYLKASERLDAWVEAAKRVPINLPEAGREFNFETAAEMADKLLDLRALGYYVPQYAIDNLLAEE